MGVLFALYRIAHPDLQSISPEGEVLYWECKTGKVQRSVGERDAKWAAHCELNHEHFYVFVPTAEAQKSVLSAINLWLDVHRPQHVWIALCQYARAMRAENPATVGDPFEVYGGVTMQTFTLTEAPRAMKHVQAYVDKDKMVLLMSRGRPELAIVDTQFLLTVLQIAHAANAAFTSGRDALPPSR